MNRVYRLWKYRCYASKLPVSKQLHGNCVPLTTTSAILDLKIIDLQRKELQHGDCANSHGLPVVTHRPSFRPLDFYRQQPADRRNNTRHKRGVAAPHSVDTQTNRPHQLPYHHIQVHIYVIVFSTSTRVMKRDYFQTYKNFVFKNATFASMFQKLHASSFSMLNTRTHTNIHIHIYLFTYINTYIYILIYIYMYEIAS